MSEYFFSYGTLQKELVQLELFGRPLESKRTTEKKIILRSGQKAWIYLAK